MLAVLCLVFAGCSMRDFLTRRLASQLINDSSAFKSGQQFFLRTGIVSNEQYVSPEYMVLQRRGWITGVSVPCSTPASSRPGSLAARASTSSAPACWDVALTPIGVETVQPLLPKNAGPSQYFPITTARRELIAVTGVSRSGSLADVDFTWKWVPDNEMGAALVPEGVVHTSTVQFKHYDDGWRLIETAQARTSQSMEDALKASETAR
ncbi:MAG TPA: hypothetical protein VFI95_04325 [Terriglobales bacterium]|nr:hypothetical protein [Terriglobales bacterium]